MQYKVHRLAEINGSGHQISIHNYQGKERSVKAPIVFGESFWADVHHYRKIKVISGPYNASPLQSSIIPLLPMEKPFS